MGAAGAGAGMTGYKQGEELGHTLNNESFSDAFGGGLGGFLGPGGSQVCVLVSHLLFCDTCAL
jgi:hypothetical protein